MPRHALEGVAESRSAHIEPPREVVDGGRHAALLDGGGHETYCPLDQHFRIGVAAFCVAVRHVRRQRCHQRGDGREELQFPAGTKRGLGRYGVERPFDGELGAPVPVPSERREEPAELPRVAPIEFFEKPGQRDDRPGAVGSTGKQATGEQAGAALDERGNLVPASHALGPRADEPDREAAVPRTRHGFATHRTGAGVWPQRSLEERHVFDWGDIVAEYEAVRRRRAEPHRPARLAAGCLANPDMPPSLKPHAELVGLRLEERGEFTGNAARTCHSEESSTLLESLSRVS